MYIFREPCGHINSNNDNNSINTNKSSNLGKADELLKYAQLLDKGYISQEEFDKVKKELL